MSNNARIKELFSLVKNGQIDLTEVVGKKIKLNELFYKNGIGRTLYSYIIEQPEHQIFLDNLFNEHFSKVKNGHYSPSNLFSQSVLYWAAVLNQTTVTDDIITSGKFQLKNLLNKDPLGTELITYLSKNQHSEKKHSETQFPYIFNQYFRKENNKYLPNQLDGKTVVYWAFRLRQFEVIEGLIAQGQIELRELFYRDEHNNSLLAYIKSQTNGQALLDILFNRFFKKDENGQFVRSGKQDSNTVLHWAVILRQHKIVKELLKNSSPNIRGCWDLTPLHYASQDGDKEMIQLLLNHSAKVNPLSRYSVNSLFFSLRNGNLEAAEMLINAGAIDCQLTELKQTSAYHSPAAAPGDNLMILAVKRGFDEIIETLKPISDVNLASTQGHHLTPTLSAIIHQQPKVLIALIKEGAKLDYVTPSAGISSWLAAAVSGNEVICNILKNNTAPANKALIQPVTTWDLAKGATPLHAVAKFNNLDAAKILLSIDEVSLDATDENGNTALHFAAQNGYYDMVDLLLSKGADYNKADNFGITPLMFAVQHGHSLIVQLLINVGAELNAQDSNGDTALHIACRLNKNEIASLLRSHKANDSIANNINDTPNDTTDHSLSKEAHRLLYKRFPFIANLGQSFSEDIAPSKRYSKTYESDSEYEMSDDDDRLSTTTITISSTM